MEITKHKKIRRKTLRWKNNKKFINSNRTEGNNK